VIRAFAILLAVVVISWSNPFQNLTAKQYSVFYKTWSKAKEFDLAYTMTAIAWQESRLGEYPLNLSDPSCGVFHVMPSTLTENKWKQSRLCERLVADYDFSFSVALQRFKYWYNYWKSKGCSSATAWKRAVCSYNAGYNWKKGLPYYRKIVTIIKQIKKFRQTLD